MQKEPCELMSLCACCQIFQPEMKERNFENTYLKETKEWVSTSQDLARRKAKHVWKGHGKDLEKVSRL